MRTVIVGIDPGGNGPEPLDPAFGSGGRLARLAGLGPGEFLRSFDRANLYSSPGERTPEDDLRAGANLLPVLRGRRVVALGRRARSALGIDQGSAWFEWSPAPGGFVASSMPHPSGLSRWWNDPANVSLASSFLRGLLRPTVHVEGVDGSGKTTLAPELARLLGCEVVPTDGPALDWDECLGRVRRRLAPGLVCDRSSGLVSELVYGPVLRGGTVAPEGEMWSVVRSLLGVVTFVYCRPPDDSMRPTFRPGESPDHVAGVRARLRDLSARYDMVVSRLSREGARVLRYDWTMQTPEGLASCVA